MTVKEAIAKLIPRTSPMPKKALKCLRENWQEAEPLLLKAIDDAIANPLDEPPAIFDYALFLCAEMRCESVFERYLDICRLPTALINHLVGNMLHGPFTAMLAATYAGRIDELKKLIEDETVYDHARSTALAACVQLVNERKEPLEKLKEYCLELLDFRLTRFPGFIWDHTVNTAASLGIKEALPLIEEAHEDGLLNPDYITLDMAKETLYNSTGVDIPLTNCTFYNLEATEIELANSVAVWTNEKFDPEDDDNMLITTIIKIKHLADRIDEIKVRTPPKRNDLCPCGSGKKFKKCCMKDPDFSGEFELNPIFKPVNTADELIDAGYYQLDEGSPDTALLCWWHAWREIIDTRMIPCEALNPSDERCDLFNCCPSFSEWLNDYLLTTVESAPNTAKNMRYSLIFLKELQDLFPCANPLMLDLISYAEIRIQLTSGQREKGIQSLKDLLQKCPDDSAISLLIAQTLGPAAKALNLRPDWDYALTLLKKTKTDEKNRNLKIDQVEAMMLKMKKLYDKQQQRATLRLATTS